MHVVRYVAKRILLLVPQLLLISIATFVLVRMLPGDPARLQLGPFASQEAVDDLRARMRLDEPLPQQYFAYLRRLSEGDLGRSWVNASEVKADLVKRVPATLELISLSMLLVLLVLIPLGVVVSISGGSAVARAFRRVGFVYSAIAGALPDFWLALVLVYVFYTKLGIAPGPEGRLSILVSPPPFVTGFYTVDALLAGDFETFADAARHLPLPVFTLAAVYGAAIYKMTYTAMSEALGSGYTIYAKSLGLRPIRVIWYAFRNAAPPIITMVGVVSGYLLGAAVLVETVFNFNGVGQYVVQAIVTADYAPLEGFVLVAATFTMLVYLAVDLAYFIIDPRVRAQRR